MLINNSTKNKIAKYGKKIELYNNNKKPKNGIYKWTFALGFPLNLNL
jgi:hypothetical protein